MASKLEQELADALGAWRLRFADPGFMNKLYRIGRRQDGRAVVTVMPDPYPLRRVVYYSPAGLDYGYHGGGPANLALSILADLFGEERGEGRAWRHHQAVLERFVAPLDPRGDHEIDGYPVRRFCEQREQSWPSITSSTGLDGNQTAG